MNRKIALQLRNFEPWEDTARAMAKYGFCYASMGFGDKAPLLRDEYYVRRAVDLESVLRALADTGYEGYLTLETVFHYDHPIDSYMHYLYESVKALDEILQGYKK